MARMMLSLAGDSLAAPLLVAVGLFIAVLVLVALCVKHKLSNHQRQKNFPCESPAPDAGDRGGFRYGEYAEEEGLGESLWQKNIILGGKCRPLEFSGVIYYDGCGNRVLEMPRSPNVAPPVPPSPLRSLTFPAEH